jgi:hypothetical protein
MELHKSFIISSIRYCWWSVLANLDIAVACIKLGPEKFTWTQRQSDWWKQGLRKTVNQYKSKRIKSQPTLGKRNWLPYWLAKQICKVINYTIHYQLNTPLVMQSCYFSSILDLMSVWIDYCLDLLLVIAIPIHSVPPRSH